MAIFITRIMTNDEGRVHIEYKECRTADLKGADTFAIKSSQKAVEEFYRTLSSLRDFVPSLCELPDEYNFGISVKGVQFEYIGDELIMNASIHAKKLMKYSDGVLSIETPSRPSKVKDNTKKHQMLPKPVIHILESLLDYAEGYIGGERGQTELALELVDEKTGELVAQEELEMA